MELQLELDEIMAKNMAKTARRQLRPGDIYYLENICGAGQTY